MNVLLNYLIQFVLGGGIIVLMSFLAKNFHPKYAALVYAIPIQFTLAAIFIYFGTNSGSIQELAKHSLYYTVAFVGFIVLFYLLMKHFSFWSSLGLSYVFFIAAILLILNLF